MFSTIILTSGYELLPIYSIVMNAEHPERSYGADCRIYLPENPTSRFKNVYVCYLCIFSFCFMYLSSKYAYAASPETLIHVVLRTHFLMSLFWHMSSAGGGKL